MSSVHVNPIEREKIEMTPLRGSPKQIQWAERIRLDWIQPLYDLKERFAGIDVQNEEERKKMFEEIEDSRFYHPRDFIMILARKFDTKTPEEFRDKLEIIYQIIRKKSQAGWWIDIRDKTIQGVLLEIQDRIEEAYRQFNKDEEEIKEEKKLEEAVLEETVLRPANPLSKEIAKIQMDQEDQSISIFFPRKMELFRETVKNLGYHYSWERKCWSQTITEMDGSLIDRCVEVSHCLLSSGFIVRIDEDEARDKLSRGELIPRWPRWICYVVKGKWQGRLKIQWTDDFSYESDIADIPTGLECYKSSKTYYVSPREYEAILDLVDQHDFKMTSRASAEIEKQKKRDEKTILMEDLTEYPQVEIQTKDKNPSLTLINKDLLDD